MSAGNEPEIARLVDLSFSKLFLKSHAPSSCTQRPPFLLGVGMARLSPPHGPVLLLMLLQATYLQIESATERPIMVRPRSPSASACARACARVHWPHPALAPWLRVTLAAQRSRSRGSRAARRRPYDRTTDAGASTCVAARLLILARADAGRLAVAAKQMAREAPGRHVRGARRAVRWAAAANNLPRIQLALPRRQGQAR